MNTIESDLYFNYCQSIERYAKIFGYSQKIMCTQITIIKQSVKINPFYIKHNFILDPEKKTIRIQTCFHEISDFIIDFCAVLSFIPPIFLENRNLLIFLFLLKANNNENIQVKRLYNEYLSIAETEFEKIMYSFSPLVDLFFKQNSISHIMIHFIPYLKSNISNVELIQSISQYFLASYAENLDLSIIRNIIQNEFDFTDFFSNKNTRRTKLRIKDNLSDVYSIFVRNFPKIGLKPYYFVIKLWKDKSKNMKILDSFFQKVPFFGYFNLSNHIFTFYCYIPEDCIENIRSYLQFLQSNGYFQEYNYYQYEFNKHFIQFDSKLSNSIDLTSIFPFNSKNYYNDKINIKKNSVLGENIKIFCEEYNYGDILLDSEEKFVDSLTLFIYFNSPRLFLNFIGYNSKDRFLQNIKKEIGKSSYTNIIKKYPNINGIEKQFKKFQETGIFSEFSLLSKMKKWIQTKDENERQRGLKFFNFLKKFKIYNPKAFIDDNFKNLCLFPYENIKSCFSKKNYYNQESIRERIYFLFKSRMISQSKVKQVGSLLNSHKMNILINIQLNSRIIWLEKVLFLYYHAKFSGFNTSRKILHHYLFFLNYSNYSIFFQFLMLENLQIADFFYNTIVKDIDDSLILFKPYTDKLWNSSSFSLDFLKEKANEQKERYQITEKKSLFKYESSHNVQYKFKFQKFYKTLSNFNRINKTSNSLLKIRFFVVNLLKEYITKHYFNSIHIESFKKEYFFMNFSSYDRFKNIVMNSVSENILTMNKKNIIIYIQQPNANLNPFQLKSDPLLRGLFSINLIDGWFFGGKQNPILILQYNVPETHYFNDSSEWNRMITNLTRKYPSLNLEIFEVNKERRFYNAQSIFSPNPRYNEYLHLSLPKEVDETINNPYELIYDFDELSEISGFPPFLKKFQDDGIMSEEEMEKLFNMKLIFSPNFFNWQFFQLIQYPVSVFIKIESVPEKKYSKLIVLFEQLPIGRILEISNLGNKNKDLAIFLQLRDNIPRFFQRLVGILDLHKLVYYITPVLTLDLYEESEFKRIMQISRNKFKFRTKKGELLEIPIFLRHQQQTTYTLRDQITIYEALREVYPKIKGQITHQNWKKVLRSISELYEAENFTIQEIVSEISNQYSVN